MRRRRQGLSQGGEDDEDQLQTVHALAADDVGDGAESDLTDDGAPRGSYLDAGIRVIGDLPLVGTLPEDDAQHGANQIDGEDVVGVGEEADASHHDSPDVIPAKWGLVDLGQGQTTSFVWVGDMSVIVVEVVEGGVTARRLVRHDEMVRGNPRWRLSLRMTSTLGELY